MFGGPQTRGSLATVTAKRRAVRRLRPEPLRGPLTCSLRSVGFGADHRHQKSFYVGSIDGLLASLCGSSSILMKSAVEWSLQRWRVGVGGFSEGLLRVDTVHFGSQGEDFQVLLAFGECPGLWRTLIFGILYVMSFCSAKCILSRFLFSSSLRGGLPLDLLFAIAPGSSSI